MVERAAGHESGMMNVERQHSAADGPRRRSYRPEGLPGVSAAAIFFVLIYWLLFAFWLQDIDLNQPPAWWLSQTQTFPLLRAVPIPFVTFFTRAFSWRVLRHILIPGILGWWLANEATTGFLRNFYNFPTRAEAANFLSRLQASVQSVSVEPAPTATPSSGASRTKLRPTSVLTLITLPFMAVFLLLLLYSFVAPPSPLRRTIYTVLIVALGFIWAIVVVLYGFRYFASSSPGTHRHECRGLHYAAGELETAVTGLPITLLNLEFHTDFRDSPSGLFTRLFPQGGMMNMASP